MSPNDIFAQMPESTCATMLGEMFENEKPLYKNLIDNLAKQRKLRPVFVERKPRVERFAWIKEALGDVYKRQDVDRLVPPLGLLGLLAHHDGPKS